MWNTAPNTNTSARLRLFATVGELWFMRRYPYGLYTVHNNPHLIHRSYPQIVESLFFEKQDRE